MLGRKKVDWVDPSPDEASFDRVDRLTAAETQRASMKKDWLLIQAAVATDRSVVSLDKHARELFARAASQLRSLRQIAWVNPDQPEENPIEWLHDGAQPEEHRTLGWTG